jgi:hypothetical protein
MFVALSSLFFAVSVACLIELLDDQRARAHHRRIAAVCVLLSIALFGTALRLSPVYKHYTTRISTR